MTKKNKLYKYLSSSLWGEIVRFNQIVVGDFHDLIYGDYNIRDHKAYEDRDVFYLLPKSKPYKHNLARLKPFLVALSRYYMCNLIYNNHIINNIIRIQTDGIVLNKQKELKDSKYAPVLENKSTGLIIWYNVNDNDRLKEKRESRLRAIKS